MIYVYRFLLVVCPALVGLAAGTWIGGHYFVPKGSGLAGGPIALGYGLGAAALLLALGAAGAYYLKGVVLQRAALASALVAAVVYGGLGYRAMAKNAREREPEEAFAPAGRFVVTMDRLDLSDPYLFVKMTVDSKARKWTQVGPAPEGKTCSASMRSAGLIDVRKALDKLVAAQDQVKTACDAAGGPAIKRLSWTIEGKKGILEVSEKCAGAAPEVGRALHLIDVANLLRGGRVECQ